MFNGALTKLKEAKDSLLKSDELKNEIESEDVALELPEIEQVHADEYSDESFWNKCTKYAKAIGGKGLEQAFTLYFATENEKCTLVHKTAIYGALGYLISPIDAIPDLTPILGYTDDMGLIATALVGVASCIDEKTREKAKDKVNKLFNSEPEKNEDNVSNSEC
ncbi:YkvA family protein [Psychromonas aquimarina]|uniref:YkvA family protein n=1 Tax=Psychromonas aquimarina TaxID=444919 RepID=UPI0003FC5E4D|nr:YkvA family protein [Psychromonas aquimarina]